MTEIPPAQHEVCKYEKRIGKTENRIVELETEIKFKEKRIDDLYSKMEEIDTKLDKIADSVHMLQLQSVQDDYDIDKRVTSLENTVNVLKWVCTLVFGSGIIWIVLTHAW